jgi:hypothetical protein
MRGATTNPPPRPPPRPRQQTPPQRLNQAPKFHSPSKIRDVKFGLLYPTDRHHRLRRHGQRWQYRDLHPHRHHRSRSSHNQQLADNRRQFLRIMKERAVLLVGQLVPH